jgi:hypothetical protein
MNLAAYTNTTTYNTASIVLGLVMVALVIVVVIGAFRLLKKSTKPTKTKK